MYECVEYQKPELFKTAGNIYLVVFSSRYGYKFGINQLLHGARDRMVEMIWNSPHPNFSSTIYLRRVRDDILRTPSPRICMFPLRQLFALETQEVRRSHYLRGNHLCEWVRTRHVDTFQMEYFSRQMSWFIMGCCHNGRRCHELPKKKIVDRADLCPYRRTCCCRSCNETKWFLGMNDIKLWIQFYFLMNRRDCVIYLCGFSCFLSAVESVRNKLSISMEGLCLGHSSFRRMKSKWRMW